MRRTRKLILQILGGGLAVLGVLTILNVSFPGSVTLLSAFAIVAGVLILLDRV